MPDRKITDVLKRHVDELMAVPGVVGIAEGDSQGMPCIRVFVVDRGPELLEQIPNIIEGYSVQIEQSSEFKPLST